MEGLGIYMLGQIYIYAHLKDKKGIFFENVNNDAGFVNMIEVCWQQNGMYFIWLLKSAQPTLESTQTTIMQLAAEMGDAEPSVRIRG